MATIKEIAELAGVSRGTVDRALNNRGSVNPQTKKKIMEIAQALDYRPNKAGLALAARKKKYKLGIILFSEKNPFFDEIMEGILAKSYELADFGVSLVTRRIEFDASAQLEAIDEFVRDGVHGLIIAPYDHESILQKMKQLADQQIPIVTVNTDIANSKRLAYVGSDHFKEGCTAAGLFGLITSGDINLGIITGSNNILCHNERIQGFQYILEKDYPRIHVSTILENHDDEFESYALTRKLLSGENPPDAFFFTAGGVHGGCRAIQESGLLPKVISFDEVPTTLEMLNNRVISATISQQPYLQGTLSLEILYNYLTTGECPENGSCLIEHTIKIRENIVR